MKRLPPASFLFASLLLAAPAPAQFHSRIYPAPKGPLSLAGLPPGAAPVRVTTRDGLTLTGIDIPGRADRPVLLILHGNASDADDVARWLAPAAARGYAIVAADYRGYARNPGVASEAGLAHDADAFYAHAKAVAKGRPVIVVGTSLGGGVAFGLARRHQLSALVTVGTFTRLRAMAPRIARALIPDRYENAAAVALLDEPLFLIHGTADDTVPVTEGRSLARAATAAHKPGALFLVDGAGHHPAGTIVADLIDIAAAMATGRPAPALPSGVHRFGFAVR